MSILALDIAFANLGWAVFQNGKPVAYGTLKTEKDARKTVKASDDRASRAAVLAEGLKYIIGQYGPQGIVGELPSGSQNAVAAYLMAMASGVVVGVASANGLPCEWISEGDSKKAALGKRTATKEEMMDWCRGAWGEVEFPKIKSHFEHVADACAAYNGLKSGVLVRAFG